MAKCVICDILDLIKFEITAHSIMIWTIPDNTLTVRLWYGYLLKKYSKYDCEKGYYCSIRRQIHPHLVHTYM